MMTTIYNIEKIAIAGIIAGIVLLPFAGCTKNKIQVSPVAGTVTLKGQPLAGAFVSFVSKDGSTRNASATTDAAGRFNLLAFGAAQTGAMPGEYDVFISKTIAVDKQGREIIVDNTPPSPVPADSPSAILEIPIQKSLIPEKYNVSDKPILEAAVVKGKNQFTFDLTE